MYDFGFRAVKQRCALDLSALWLFIPQDEVLAILKTRGFRVVEVDMVALARGLIGRSRYVFDAKYKRAPQVVNCSSMVKWLYARRGIWLPKYAVEQREMGKKVDKDGLKAGDLVFKAGTGWNLYHLYPDEAVGHVGLATGQGTVIHAADSKRGVVEDPIEHFVENGAYRGARRIMPDGHRVVTLICPAQREIEHSSQLRWLVLPYLPEP
ncbi:MAG: Murein DD-endopeptidase MepS/Murein LD-carboxypeptidase precursor [Parcubacteria group bacterium ADurb.Bin192]|nr:MAG: Murein DD-endopeptidase MepS/Murein LD-carboxypeptidase precursor [Parcubacteria group bacterium ADurb.Bin192]